MRNKVETKKGKKGRPARLTTTPSDVDFLGDDLDFLPEEPHAEPAGAAGDGVTADDALGLYLKQMGSIRMLNRLKRARWPVAWSWSGAVTGGGPCRAGRFWPGWWTYFSAVQAGEVAIERVIDAVPSLGLNGEEIGTRLPKHLEELQRALQQASLDLRELGREKMPSRRSQLRRVLRRLTPGGTGGRGIVAAHRDADRLGERAETPGRHGPLGGVRFQL